MKKTIAIAVAVLISFFATFMSLTAALVLVFTGSVLWSRVYLQSKTLPKSQAIALKSSTANRVGQVLVLVPLVTVVVVFVAFSGFLK